jgi:hypothetical protein
MANTHKKTVQVFQKETHKALMEVSAVKKRTYGGFQVILAILIPPLTFFALQNTQKNELVIVPSPPEPVVQMRAAAPEGYVDDEKDIDDTEVQEFLCTEICTNKEARQEEFLQEFCREACGIEDMLLQEKTLSLPDPTTLEVTVPNGELSSEETTEPSYKNFKVPENYVFVGERRPHNHRGIYLNTQGVKLDSIRTRAFSNLERVDGNAFVFDVKGTRVYFHSDAPLANEMGLVSPVYDLPELIQEAKNNGLYTIARFIVAKDPSLATRKPETQILNQYSGKGIGSVWVNPGHDTVLEYNGEVLRDVLSSGVDEVNFDYIRYPTEYSQKAIGLTGEEKADEIEKFLVMAREMVEELGTSTKLGISTYAILGWNFPINFEPLGQDIARFAPLVDVISPMAYPATFSVGGYYNRAKHPGSRMYYLVYRTLQGYKELLGEDSWKLRPWIQGYYVNGKNVADQARAVYDSGLCGFTMWNAQNSYTESYKGFESAKVPERCA